MALTQDELQSIVSAVLSSLQTNSRTIDQLTMVTSLSDNDCFEINGGKKVSYGVFINLIKTLYSTEQDTLKTLINKCELSSVDITADDGVATITISSKGKEISTSIPIASTSQAGLMTSKDKQNLDTAKETASTAKNMAESAINNIGTESSLRANADNELRASLALLKNTVNINEENLNDIEDKYKDLRTEIVYLVMRLDGITDGIPDHVGAAASRRYYFDRESKQFYFTDDYQVGIFNHGLQRLFLVGDDLYIFIDNDLRLIHAAPIEVKSEEAMAELIASGEIDDNRMYYIPESN